jgi:hypothetical protein
MKGFFAGCSNLLSFCGPRSLPSSRNKNRTANKTTVSFGFRYNRVSYSLLSSSTGVANDTPLFRLVKPFDSNFSQFPQTARKLPDLLRKPMFYGSRQPVANAFHFGFFNISTGKNTILSADLAPPLVVTFAPADASHPLEQQLPTLLRRPASVPMAPRSINAVQITTAAITRIC